MDAELAGLAAAVTGGGSGTEYLPLRADTAGAVTGTSLAIDGGMAGLRTRPRTS
jgi:hypothetical protein